MNAVTEDKLISVIMPAFNASEYISAAVDSILSQSYTCFELIIVDDGSTDDTASIINDYSLQDSRVKLFTLKNAGPANARNKGLSFISKDSEYIVFCDSDDRYYPDAFEKLIDAARNGADAVFAGFIIINPDNSKNAYFEPFGEYDGRSFGEALPALYKANLLNQVWAKMFRTKMVSENAISFPNYRWGEDRLFIYDVLDHAERIVVIPNITYLYIMHGKSSLITGFYEPKPQICIESDKRIQSLCKKFGIENTSVFSYMFVKGIFSCFANLCSESCTLTKSQKRNYIRTTLEDRYIKKRIQEKSFGIADSVLRRCLLTENPQLILTAAKTVQILSKTAPKLFLLIKHKK